MSFLSREDFARRGDALALVARDATITYAELAARAETVARAIAEIGLAPGDHAALVSSARGLDEAIALAAMLTSGVVVVPLDATAPAARLASICGPRGVRAIACDPAAGKLADAIDATLGAPLGRVVLDPSGAVVETRASSAPRREPALDLACVLHTSGSTGTPKPVPITWAGLDAFTRFLIELVAIEPSDRVLRVAELIFDLAWFDHAATWRAGATLCAISRRELAAGRAFADALADLRPTIVYGVPSLFMKVVGALREGELVAPCPRAVFFAGEVYPPKELAAFAERVPSARLWNLYGPTETNVCTYHEVLRDDLDGARETPIGKETPYAKTRLVAEDGRVIEGAGTGELVVEGPSTIGGGPYATRDRVERGADGLYYFRGRLDRMVKVRGYRVEPGDVESVLAAHAAVRQAAVLPHDDPRLGRTLRAWVALASPGAATEKELRMHAAAKLPPYMVPEKIALLDDLPRTATGKIDYARLGL